MAKSSIMVHVQDNDKFQLRELKADSFRLILAIGSMVLGEDGHVFGDVDIFLSPEKVDELRAALTKSFPEAAHASE